jgi:hypothetical protein
MLWVILLSTAGGIIFVYNKLVRKKNVSLFIQDDQKKLACMFMVLGLLLVVLGQIPIFIIGAHIVQETQDSRFGLAAVVGSSMFVAGAVVYLSRQYKYAVILTAVLVAGGAACQYRNSYSFKEEQNYNKNFFYQLAWRAPHIKKGTAFFLDYNPVTNGASTHYTLGTAVNGMYGINDDISKQYYWVILSNTSESWGTSFSPNVNIKSSQFGFITFNGNTSQSIALSQPEKGCLRVVDSSNRNILSMSTNTELASRVSNPSFISEKESPAINYDYLNMMFGKPNINCWCYYFEKAELARQFGEWPKVLALLQEALKQKLVPENDEEWVVYVEACVHQHDYEEARKTIVERVQTRETRTYIYSQLKKLEAHSQTEQSEIGALINLFQN